MEISEAPLDGLLVFKPRVFEDERGSFFESFNQKTFNEATDHKYQFVQDNQSLSKKGVLRGLHFQNPPYAQGKLVRVIQGAVLDIAVDIRKNSSTYGEYFGIELSAENNVQLWIPPGFAHGFVALEHDTIFSYKCTDYYNPGSERTLMWNDKDLNIDWKIDGKTLISEKDKLGKEFRTFASDFEMK